MRNPWRDPPQVAGIEPETRRLPVRRFAIRVDPVGTHASLRRHFARLARLLRMLLGDPFALLGLPSSCLCFLKKLLRLLAPLSDLALASAPCPERNQHENDQHTDRNHDPYPSGHLRPPSLVRVFRKKRP